MYGTFIMIYAVSEYIANRTKLLLIDVSKDRILCLYFCTADNWKNFLQTSFWLHTFSKLDSPHSHALLVPGAG